MADLLPFTMAVGLAILSPGPGIAALLSMVLANGQRSGFLFTFGVVLGDLVWLLIAMTGLSALLHTAGPIFMLIKWLSIAYLCYIGWQLWSAPATSLSNAEAPSPSSCEKTSIGPVVAGWAVTMANPKAIAFYVALLPTLIDLKTATAGTFITIGFIVSTSIIIVYGGYTLVAERVRRALDSGRTVATLNRISAIALLGAAAWVALM